MAAALLAREETWIRGARRLNCKLSIRSGCSACYRLERRHDACNQVGRSAWSASTKQHLQRLIHECRQVARPAQTLSVVMPVARTHWQARQTPQWGKQPWEVGHQRRSGSWHGVDQALQHKEPRGRNTAVARHQRAAQVWHKLWQHRQGARPGRNQKLLAAAHCNETVRVRGLYQPFEKSGQQVQKFTCGVDVAAPVQRQRAAVLYSRRHVAAVISCAELLCVVRQGASSAWCSGVT